VKLAGLIASSSANIVKLHIGQGSGGWHHRQRRG